MSDNSPATFTMINDEPSVTTNPFADPTLLPCVTERDIIVEPTLAVGRDASLTLNKDAVIVSDDEHRERPRTICGIRISTQSTAIRSIPYYNILSANLTNTDIIIKYAKPTTKSSKARLYVHNLIYPVSSEPGFAEKWVARLLDRAYGASQRKKRIKVLINPFGGTGRAAQYYNKHVAPIFEAAECIVDLEHTKYRGHAIEIAESLNINAYDVLACASGDGLPMESFNGLARKSNATEALRKVAVVQLPCGTGNAMSWNLNGTAEPSLAALAIVKGVRTPLDLASITQASSPNVRTLSFLSQSIGIVADSDLGTDNIRWMGDVRFTFGILVRVFGKTLYPVDIAVRTQVEDKEEVKRHYAREVEKRHQLGLGAHDIIDHNLESATALGLPPLKYGTIADPLPPPTSSTSTSGWSPLTSYPNLGNFYCGNMAYVAADTPFFPAALPNDGLLDLVTIDGDISRKAAIGLLLDTESGRMMMRDEVRYRKVTCVRIVPRFGWAGAEKLSQPTDDTDGSTTTRKDSGFLARLFGKLAGGAEKEGYFSVDGEKMPFEPFQIEVHRGLGTVLSKQVGLYEYAQGPIGWKDYQSTETDF